MICEAR